MNPVFASVLIVVAFGAVLVSAGMLFVLVRGHVRERTQERAHDSARLHDAEERAERVQKKLYDDLDEAMARVSKERADWALERQGLMRTHADERVELMLLVKAANATDLVIARQAAHAPPPPRGRFMPTDWADPDSPGAPPGASEEVFVPDEDQPNHDLMV